MRLKLDARARRWLRRLPVINLYYAAELALMAVLAAQAARLIWVLATPVSPLGDWRPAGVTLPGSAASILSGFDPFFRLAGPAGPATVTSLQLTLFGIRLDEATGRGSAIVAGPDGVQQSVAVGGEIVPGVRLKAVAFDHVTLDRGGADEELFLDQSGAGTPAAPVPGGAPAPQPDAGAAGGVPITQVRADIGFIPRIDGGRISGLVVRPQGSGDAFRRAGLQPGDVVTALAGRPVTGPGDFDGLAAQYAGGGTIPITVERGQQTLSLSLSVSAPRP